MILGKEEPKKEGTLILLVLGGFGPVALITYSMTGEPAVPPVSFPPSYEARHNFACLQKIRTIPSFIA